MEHEASEYNLVHHPNVCNREDMLENFKFLFYNTYHILHSNSQSGNPILPPSSLKTEFALCRFPLVT